MEDTTKPIKPREGLHHPLEQRMLPLPLTWRMKLDENYTVFRDNLKLDGLADFLTLTDEQKANLNGMIDNHQRTDYLLKQVLPYGTKQHIKKLKEGLKATDQNHLIQYLPTDACKRSMSDEVVKKKKRKMETRSMSEGDELPIMVHINGPKYAKIMKQQEELKVNIREYITDCDGKVHPTKKGILFSMKDWQSFKKEMKKVDHHIKNLKIA